VNTVKKNTPTVFPLLFSNTAKESTAQKTQCDQCSRFLEKPKHTAQPD